MRPTLFCASVLAACLLFTAESQAGNGWGHGIHPGIGYFGFGYSGSLYGLGLVPVPPYYALHPPVYYSHQIVRRPMGDSPYAYPAQRPAPPARPHLIWNPFLPQTLESTSPAPTPTSDAVAQVIENPFVRQDEQAVAGLIFNPYVAQSVGEIAQSGR